tara:strand:- start:392 stop:613 length:222 start_codon:yes stop_codon:yes gene_type:complete
MINNLKLNHIDQAQAQTIKDNEIELLRVVDCFNDGFQIGNDKDQYIIVRKLKKNDKKKKDNSIIAENSTELLR